ncbi:MAG: hypothetical protein JWR40_1959 [Massilia sp.]|nr:hypothetical protein [Massilia sp.]
MKTTPHTRSIRTLSLALLGLALTVSPAVHAANSSVVPERFRPLALGVFALVIGMTLMITYYAGRQRQSAGEFYTAGGGISGIKNGFAIAGDYLSAAAFLGVSGLVALYGYDGMLYVTGFFVAFVPVLLLIAEPCRNIGQYTMGDILAFRNRFRPAKLVTAVSSIIVAIFYLVPQIVGGALLIKALVGVEYEISILIVGSLMLVYVFFGGMRATTWVQIIKAVLLVLSCFMLVTLSWAPFGFSAPALFDAIASSPALQSFVGALLGPAQSPSDMGQRFFEPGLYLKNPIEQISLGLALILGTAAMPHIMMRFFTVPDAKAARSSVLWSMLIIGTCHLLIVAIGFAAAYYVGSATIASFDKGGNLAAPLLAQFLGGGPDAFLGNLFLAFVAAVAFATIVAVVAGLTLAAAGALAHDIYVGTIKNGVATAREQVVAAKASSLIVGIIGIVIALLAKGQNVAHLVGLAFAVAASANLPALLMTLYWRRCNTAGVVIGVIGGTVCAIVLVLVSPNVQYPLLQQEEAMRARAAALVETLKIDASLHGALDEKQRAELIVRKQVAGKQEQAALATLEKLAGGSMVSLVGLERPLMPLRNPGLISIPLGFLLVVLGSLLFTDRRSIDKWDELKVRRYTGIGRAGASAH